MMRAFTLIELLVVITIIMVLLALLTPALDKAIYQAELTVCAANLRTVTSGVTAYAFGSTRRYPHRPIPRRGENHTNDHVAATDLVRPTAQYDLRPPLRTFFSINKNLRCVLVEEVDLDDTKIDEFVGASYTMWWGWGYDSDATGTLARMDKIGDRWAMPGERFTLLAGDYDLWLGGGDANPLQGSHPDHDGKLQSFAFKYKSLLGAGAAGVEPVPITGALWMRPGNTDRGLIDMNHGYADGSVARFNGVKEYDIPADERDQRTSFVWNMSTGQQLHKYYQIPKQ